ncbi:hypothetical protein [Streptomyces sp. SAI-127]|uniref:hypothetical protein n=1 Tax=Streptomyces sp. SAI-127 TaxID=2940543 RepID=UPI0024748B7B|nr:hypothetical protein [Streptomyces sp. SAI-127]MDH6492171.1 hypothetical protein [Streptomyces sp. SAI-127]
MALTTLTERVQQRAANVAGPEDFRHDRGEGVNETTAGHGHDIQQYWADIEAELPKHVSVDLFPAALRQVPPKVRKCTRRSRRLQDGGTSIPAFPAPPTPTAPVPPSDTDGRPADGTLAWPRELSPKFPLAVGQEHLGDAGCGEDTDVPGAAVGDVGQSFEAESWQAHLEVLHLMVVQLPHRD